VLYKSSKNLTTHGDASGNTILLSENVQNREAVSKIVTYACGFYKYLTN